MNARALLDEIKRRNVFRAAALDPVWDPLRDDPDFPKADRRRRNRTKAAGNP